MRVPRRAFRHWTRKQVTGRMAHASFFRVADLGRHRRPPLGPDWMSTGRRRFDGARAGEHDATASRKGGSTASRAAGNGRGPAAGSGTGRAAIPGAHQNPFPRCTHISDPTHNARVGHQRLQVVRSIQPGATGAARSPERRMRCSLCPRAANGGGGRRLHRGFLPNAVREESERIRELVAPLRTRSLAILQKNAQ